MEPTPATPSAAAPPPGPGCAPAAGSAAEGPSSLATPAVAGAPAVASPPAVAAPPSSPPPAARPGRTRRAPSLRDRELADQARVRGRYGALVRRGVPTALLAVALVLAAYLGLRGAVLRTLARLDPTRGWAVERLLELRDPWSFDLYMLQLGRAEVDHAGYNRAVFLLGGRRALPVDEDGEPLAEDAGAVAEHRATLLAALRPEAADPFGPLRARGALYALWTLHDRPWAATEDLLLAAAAHLASQDDRARAYAALVLKATPAPREAWDALARASEADPSPLVRRLACQALGATGAASVAPALVRAVGDDAPDVRREATLALARLRVDVPFEQLERIYREDEAACRADVLEAVAGSPDPRALALLVAGLAEEALVTRCAAVAGLARRPEPGAREALERALATDEPAVRAAAAAGLAGRADGRAAVPALVAALPRHDGRGELAALHEALVTLTGASLPGPGPTSETWPPVVEGWRRWLAERGGRP